MDQHLIPNAIASDEERATLDALIGPPESLWEGGSERSTFEGHMGRGGHELRNQRQHLLPALQAMQSRIGYISPGALNYICQRLGVPPGQPGSHRGRRASRAQSAIKIPHGRRGSR